MNERTNMNVKIDLKNVGIPMADIVGHRELAESKLDMLFDESSPLEYTGWVDFPNRITDGELSVIEMLADNIRETSDVLVVLGVGGSYMGAKALTDIIPGDGSTEVVFAGYDFSTRHTRELIEKLGGGVGDSAGGDGGAGNEDSAGTSGKRRDFSICAISKSGGTMETMAAFSIMMDYAIKRYGADEAAARTYVVTEDKPSALHNYAERIGCHIIHMPLDIGGRYSVFTGVGLLPLAVHGINIREFIEGTRALARRDAFVNAEAAQESIEHLGEDGTAELDDSASIVAPLDYAIARNILHAQGKSVEVFEFFDPYAEFFGNWIQQLFGESEGKDGKGLYPTTLTFNRDLHSMGQFLQEGAPCFLETMVLFGKQPDDLEIPTTEIVPELSNRKIADISRFVEQGVIEAHRKAGIPLITISIDEITPRSMGELMYFFMIQCAVSGLILGVNPFDQPGVEAYKSEVKALLK